MTLGRIHPLLRSSFRYAHLLLALLLVAGCKPRAPYDIVPISGSVTYDDGSPIPGKRVVVTFLPQVAPVNPKQHPHAGMTDLKPDGSFSEVTTWKYADGVIVGPQKVTVVSIGERQQPTSAVDPIYSNLKTTPLSAEITPETKRVELKIPLPGAAVGS